MFNAAKSAIIEVSRCGLKKFVVVSGLLNIFVSFGLLIDVIFWLLNNDVFTEVTFNFAGSFSLTTFLLSGLAPPLSYFYTIFVSVFFSLI